MRYYIKRCGRQELGSVGADGKPRRGRYLLTSKSPEVLSFFPPLSETHFNDYAPVGIVPLYTPGNTFYCNFVYHNDKYHGSVADHPRDEYRLYLNKDVEGGDYRFKEGDYIIFRRQSSDSDETKLYLCHVPPSSEQLYVFCSELMASTPLRGGYAVYEGTIDEFEVQVPQSDDTTQTVVIDPTLNQKLQNDTAVDRLTQLFKNQVMFRDFLLAGYEGKCAITRKIIRYGELMNIEAAHIRPRAHEGTSLPNNGFMLSRDFHWAFDKGFFTLTDDLRVMIHPKISSDVLTPFANQSIFIPKDSFFQPALENVRWHRDKVFGLFLTQGSIRETVAQ